METEINASRKTWGEEARPGWSTITMTDLERISQSNLMYKFHREKVKDEDYILDKEVEEKIKQSLKIIRANEVRLAREEQRIAKENGVKRIENIIARRLVVKKLRSAGVGVETIIIQGDGPMYNFEAIKVGDQASNFCMRLNDIVYSCKIAEYAKMLKISQIEIRSIMMTATNLGLTQFEYLGAYFKKRTSQRIKIRNEYGSRPVED